MRDDVRVKVIEEKLEKWSNVKTVNMNITYIWQITDKFVEYLILTALDKITIFYIKIKYFII